MFHRYGKDGNASFPQGMPREYEVDAKPAERPLEGKLSPTRGAYENVMLGIYQKLAGACAELLVARGPPNNNVGIEQIAHGF